MMRTCLKVGRVYCLYYAVSGAKGLLLILDFMVRWIQAKCAVVRCQEELVILPLEMERCILGYRHQAKLWRGRAQSFSPGHRCYALRKASVWLAMAERADRCFRAVLGPDILFT